MSNRRNVYNLFPKIKSAPNSIGLHAERIAGLARGAERHAIEHGRNLALWADTFLTLSC